MDASSSPHDPTQQAPLAAMAPPRSQPPKRRNWLGWFIAVGILVAGFMTMGLLLLALLSLQMSDDASIEEKYHSLATDGKNKIAIISVEGAIIDGEGYVKQQIDRVRKDKDVKAVVIRVDSPGGTVNGSDYIYHHLKKLRTERELPMVVSMGALAASGGYYVAMAAGDTPDILIAEPSTWVGSIGVIIPHYNLAGLAEKLEIKDDSIKSHPLKAMGSPLREMTEEEKQIFKALVDDGFERFKQIVRGGRKKFQNDPAALDKLATGQIYTTTQGIANGLVDKEGYIEDAITRARELAGLSETDTKVVKYKRPFSLLSGLLISAKSSQPLDASSLANLLTPKAYYLYAWPQQAALGATGSP